MLEFFPECLHHIEGDKYGQPFVLERWQQAVLANLFGWQRLDSQGRQVRRYREMLLYVPRKNGKTPLVAGLGAAVLFCDAEKGQQDYVAAGEREQAGNLFRYCKGMVELEPELAKRCTIYGGKAAAGQAKSIVIEGDYSFLRVISSDADTKHGGTTHLGIVDELHVQDSRNLVDVLRTSTASANRKQPLMVFITTADFDRPSICNEIYDYACKVRDGRISNPAFLPVIYEAPKQWQGVDLEYTDPAVYQRSRHLGERQPESGGERLTRLPPGGERPRQGDPGLSAHVPALASQRAHQASQSLAQPAALGCLGGPGCGGGP